MINEETVYTRTETGETRARQPRSITSHELRAMLLLIDGRLSVRELKRRFGASLAIDSAIAELIKLGWIEPERDRGVTEADFVDRKRVSDDDADSVEESRDEVLAEVSRARTSKPAATPVEPAPEPEVPTEPGASAARTEPVEASDATTPAADSLPEPEPEPWSTTDERRI